MTSLRLLRPHTHAGQPMAIGDRLDVNPLTADWLLTHGIARPDRGQDHLDKPVDPKTSPRKEPKA